MWFSSKMERQNVFLLLLFCGCSDFVCITVSWGQSMGYWWPSWYQQQSVVVTCCPKKCPSRFFLFSFVIQMLVTVISSQIKATTNDPENELITYISTRFVDLHSSLITFLTRPEPTRLDARLNFTPIDDAPW